MYQSIDIKSFRGISGVKLNDLARVNLILGPNNAGKTSVLEAVTLHACGPGMPYFFAAPLRSRYGEFADAFDCGQAISMLFPRTSGTSRPPDSLTLGISARWTGNGLDADENPWVKLLAGNLDFQWSFQPSLTLSDAFPGRSLAALQPVVVVSPGASPMSIPSGSQLGTWSFEAGPAKGKKAFKNSSLLFFPVSLSPPVHSTLIVGWDDPTTLRRRDFASLAAGRLKREERLEFDLLPILRSVFPKVTKVDVFPVPGSANPQVRIWMNGASSHELGAFGDAFRRWLHMALACEAGGAAVYMIDEIDAGLHPNTQRDMATPLLQLLQKRGVQLFATTHNLEFVDSLLLAASKSKTASLDDLVAVYTLRKDDGMMSIRRRSGTRSSSRKSRHRSRDPSVTFSVVICEGPRDRVVLSSLLARLHQWTPTKNATAPAEFVGGVFDGNVAYLQRNDCWIAIAERSKEQQKHMVASVRDFLLEKPRNQGWTRLLIVTDTDAQGRSVPDVKDATISRAVSLLDSFGLSRAESTMALSKWTEVAVTIPGAIPPERRKAAVRIVVLPKIDQPGNLETFLLDQLSAMSESQLIKLAVEFVASAKQIKTMKPKPPYLTKVSHPSKATVGAVLAILDPEYAYTDIRLRMEKIEWEKSSDIARTFAALGDL